MTEAQRALVLKVMENDNQILRAMQKVAEGQVRGFETIPKPRVTYQLRSV